MSSTNVNTIPHGKETPEKRQLKRISWTKVEMIIVFLYRKGPRNKTIIASLCSMNPRCCDLYLNWCIRENHVKVIVDNSGRKLFVLTERGRELYHREFEGSLYDISYEESESRL